MTDEAARDRRFLALYALAWAGATVAYVPLLTLLLPMHVDRLAGAEALRWLALTTFTGAIIASVTNIAAGWMSDRAGRRRPFVLVGLALSTAMLLAMPHAATLPMLMGVIVLWQVGLNAMLGPLSAWAGDCVPEARRGMLGGLLAFAPASGALAGALVTIPGVADLPQRFGLVGALVVVCVMPLVLSGEEGAQQSAASFSEGSAVARKVLRGMATRMWFARLLVQVSEAALFAYFYLWLRTVDPNLPDNGIARVLLTAMVIGALTALVAGRWADRRGKPVLPLALASGGAAAGLMIMALASGREGVIGGYLLFGLSTSVFLALHSAHTLRVLPDSTRRGRDLGLFNLTNTIPSLVVPSLTLALVPTLGFAGLFVVLAVLALAAMTLLSR
jgi:MFS family permease